MTTTNPNPLDRIRALAPADMTDDELGFETLRLGGREIVLDERFGIVEFHGEISEENGCRYDPDDDDDWGVEAVLAKLRDNGDAQWSFGCSNPAISYDALLPVVREWAFADAGPYPERIVSILNNLEQTGRDGRIPHDSPTYRSEYFPQYRGMWLMLVSPTRQLAEAFVTAAREVSRGH